MSDSNFDTKSFRNALGSFATGVTVITAQDTNGALAGVTANSFNSVSLDPPLILWSIAKQSSSFTIFEQASHFAVNILAADQIDLSNNFAKPSDNKFADIPHTFGLGQAPLLENCTAQFECENHQILDGGDHWIMLGKVMSFNTSNKAPLLYAQGSYAGAVPFPAPKKNMNAADIFSHQPKKLESNLFYLMTQVVRKYQQSYQPIQESMGLSVSEARILMIIAEAPSLPLVQLEGAVAMPAIDVNNAIEGLVDKGFIRQLEDFIKLTEKGAKKADQLWSLAQQQQEKVFQDFSQDQIASFNQSLIKLLT